MRGLDPSICRDCSNENGIPCAQTASPEGVYDEAKAGYEELIKSEKSPVAAIIGLADCFLAVGEYSEGLEALDAGHKTHSDNPDLLAHRADLFFFLGKWDEAAKDAETAIKQHEKNFLARWVRVTILLRDKGDIPAADKEVRWFVKAYTRSASNAEKDYYQCRVALPHRSGGSRERSLE